jgi:hypothetical protein
VHIIDSTAPCSPTFAPTMFASSLALSPSPIARFVNSEPKPLTMMRPLPSGRVHKAPSPLSASCASASTKP